MRQARNHILPIIIAVGCSFCCPASAHASSSSTTSYAAEIMKDVREDKVYLLENIRRKVTKPSEKAIIEALLCEDGPKAAKLYRKQLSDYPDPKLDDISRSRLAACDRALAATPKPVLAASKTASRTKAVSGKADSSVSRQDSIPSATVVAPRIPTTRKADSTRQQPKAPATKPAAAAKSLPEAKSAPAAAATGQPVAMTPATPSPAKAAGTAAPKAAAAGGNYTLQFGSFDSVTNADQLAAQLPPASPATVIEVGSVYKVRLKKGFATREEAAAFARTLPIESFVVPIRP